MKSIMKHLCLMALLFSANAQAGSDSGNREGGVAVKCGRKKKFTLEFIDHYIERTEKKGVTGYTYDRAKFNLPTNGLMINMIIKRLEQNGGYAAQLGRELKDFYWDFQGRPTQKSRKKRGNVYVGKVANWQLNESIASDVKQAHPVKSLEKGCGLVTLAYKNSDDYEMVDGREKYTFKFHPEYVNDIFSTNRAIGQSQGSWFLVHEFLWQRFAIKANPVALQRLNAFLHSDQFLFERVSTFWIPWNNIEIYRLNGTEALYNASESGPR